MLGPLFLLGWLGWLIDGWIASVNVVTIVAGVGSINSGLVLTFFLSIIVYAICNIDYIFPWGIYNL